MKRVDLKVTAEFTSMDWGKDDIVLKLRVTITPTGHATDSSFPLVHVSFACLLVR
jgi:hypothetical protein